MLPIVIDPVKGRLAARKMVKMGLHMHVSPLVVTARDLQLDPVTCFEDVRGRLNRNPVFVNLMGHNRDRVRMGTEGKPGP